MLAPLGLYLFLTVIECSAILLVCRAYDARVAQIEMARKNSAKMSPTVYLYAPRSQARFRAARVTARPGVGGSHHDGSNPGLDARWRLDSNAARRV
jgi:hypothetical protein